jgi:hypothetical protein
MASKIDSENKKDQYSEKRRRNIEMLENNILIDFFLTAGMPQEHVTNLIK